MNQLILFSIIWKLQYREYVDNFGIWCGWKRLYYVGMATQVLQKDSYSCLFLSSTDKTNITLINNVIFILLILVTEFYGKRWVFWSLNFSFLLYCLNPGETKLTWKRNHSLCKLNHLTTENCIVYQSCTW